MDYPQLIHLLDLAFRQRNIPVVIAPTETANVVCLNGRTFDLASLMTQCAASPDHTEIFLDRTIIQIQDAMALPQNLPSWAELHSDVLPKLAKGPPDNSALHHGFINNTVCLYVYDLPTALIRLEIPWFQRQGIGMEELHETAMQNLERRSQDIEVKVGCDNSDVPQSIILSTQDGHNASRLLLLRNPQSTLYKLAARNLGGTFVAFAPNRDNLILLRDDPGVVQTTAAQLANMVLTLSRPITADPFLVTPDGGIMPYQSGHDIGAAKQAADDMGLDFSAGDIARILAGGRSRDPRA